MGNCCKSKPVREGVDVAQSENADDEREQRSRKSQKGIVPVVGDTEEKKTNVLSKDQPRSRSPPKQADSASPLISPTIKQQEQRTKKTNKNGITDEKFDDFHLEKETKRICGQGAAACPMRVTFEEIPKGGSRASGNERTRTRCPCCKH